MEIELSKFFQDHAGLGGVVILIMIWAGEALVKALIEGFVLQKTHRAIAVPHAERNHNDLRTTADRRGGTDRRYRRDRRTPDGRTNDRRIRRGSVRREADRHWSLAS